MQDGGRSPLGRLRGVRKRFKATEALRGIDLDVPSGGVLAVLGPNGAGKTTAISLLCGLRRPDEGTVELFGGQPTDPAIRVRLGVTPQETGFPESLRVDEVLDLVRAHFPDPLPRGELVDRFGLRDVERRQTGGLSGGQKRRLAVAVAFAGRPDLVVLDEPTTGLDVESRRGLWDVLRDAVARGVTVLLTTHYLEEAEQLADAVVMLAGGRVRARGSVAEITSSVAVTRVRVTLEDEVVLPDVVQRADEKGRTTLHTTSPDELVRALVHSGVRFHGLEVAPVSLEEAFLVLTGSAEREEMAS